MILPSIIRTSSVDTNGPSYRRTGKNRRTSSPYHRSPGAVPVCHTVGKGRYEAPGIS
jgi:hypothetical protein